MSARTAILAATISLAGGVCGCSEDAAPDKHQGIVADVEDAAAAVDANQEVVDATSSLRTPDELLKGIKDVQSWTLPGLGGEAVVLHTAGDVPHIYAGTRTDLARVHGFVAARDRFFVMDMMRRLGLGKVGEVFGTAGSASDVQSRGTGMTDVADRVCAALGDDMRASIDAYAEGVNAYIAAVKVGKLPPPSELKLAAKLLGYNSPSDAMQPFARRDVCGAVAVVLFQQGYETDDIRRAALRASIPKQTQGKPNADLRLAGALDDVLKRQAPIYAVTTTPGYGLDTGKTTPPPPPASAEPERAKSPTALPRLRRSQRPMPDAARLYALHDRLATLGRRLGKGPRGGFGSNIWTVAGSHTKDGAALLASDGHLELSVPSLFWQIGLDTAALGGGETHQLGVTFAGIPLVAAGTNGDLAWSNTYLYGDITDYYVEVMTLDADGLPKSVLHAGEDMPLVAKVEAYKLAKIDLLGSPGGTVKLTRWQTWDGRKIIDIEGRPATEDELAGTSKPAKGAALCNVIGTWVVPMDMNKDGKISAVSMDLTTFDVGDTPGFVDRIGHSKSVAEAREHQRGLVGWAQNTMYADRHGSIAYSGYNPTPCRAYLPRKDGEFADGANPQELLDGTQYHGFSVPLGADGRAREDSKDPYSCIIPFAEWPQAEDPKKGYIVNANNDFGATTLDGRFADDKWYLGGPFVLGLRAKQIDDSVAKLAKSKQADIESMQATQALHGSLLGDLFVPWIVAAVDLSKSATPAVSDAIGRLKAWQARGCPAESGVATFYHQPTADQRADAVATMIFNATLTELLHSIWDDEGLALDGIDVLRATVALMRGRGAQNPEKLASWRAGPNESVFFDDAATPAIESSEQLIRAALNAALLKLASAHHFATADASKWLWGLKHMVKFEWVLASFLAGQPALQAIAGLFSIAPDKLPLADNLPAGDPRAELTGFPRPGDYGSPDAAAPNAIRSFAPGKPTWDFTYSHGPIMRMVIALGPGDSPTTGRNILPGGQSGLTDSPHFTDQVKLWLGNKTWTMHLRLGDVVANTVRAERFVAAP